MDNGIKRIAFLFSYRKRLFEGALLDVRQRYMGSVIGSLAAVCPAFQLVILYTDEDLQDTEFLRLIERINTLSISVVLQPKKITGFIENNEFKQTGLKVIKAPDLSGTVNQSILRDYLPDEGKYLVTSTNDA